MLTIAICAFLLPMLAGAALWILALGRPGGPAGWAAALGSGYLIGTIALGAAMSLGDGIAAAALRSGAIGGMAALVATAGVVAWRRQMPAVAPSRGAPVSRPEMLAILFAMVMLAAMAVLLASQSVLLPTLGWDAWNSWLAKAKAWHFATLLIPAQSFETWSSAASGTTIHVVGWPYPEALPRYAYWIALQAGSWNEAAIHFAWFGAWVALGAALFANLRLAGIGAAQSVLSAAAVLLLPMVTAHVALAGYADLWLAAMLLLATIHLYRWTHAGRRGDALIALVCVALLPMIKVEGAVWMLCILVAVGLGRLRTRWVAIAGGAAALLWLATLPWGGLRLPLPGLGVVRIGAGEIETDKFGRVALEWQSVGDEMLQTLFLLPNWSLLWYAAPIVLWLGWRAIPRDRALRTLAWFFGLGLGFLGVLFLFTDASAWAENFTSVNRVLMQIVPALVFWLSLLWAARGRHDTVRSSAA
jgi:hypothetical protein